jgi:hypothetical protein
MKPPGAHFCCSAELCIGITGVDFDLVFERFRFTKHAIAERQGQCLAAARVRLPAKRSDICRPAAYKTVSEMHHPMMSVLAQ